MNAGFNTVASRYVFPDWALAVLASPVDNRPLEYDRSTFRSLGGTPAVFRIEEQIAMLVLETESELAPFRDRFPIYTDSEHDMLRPTQVRFRQLLKAFWARVPASAIAVDIACAECEFYQYHRHVRYIPMDICAPRLERAVHLQRTNFGVVANIRRPPLQEQSVDAIVSSNTLNHLPAGDVSGIVRNLFRFLVPGGLLGVTLQADTLTSVIEALPDQARIVEIKAIEGPLSPWWHRWVHSRIKARVRRWPHFVATAGRVVAGMTSAAVAGLDRLIASSFKRTATYLWVTIQRESND